MVEKSYEPQLPTASDESGNLTSEQQDTAKLIEELLGKAVADRYVDFCKLSAGSLGLRVSLPMAAHALREMDSIFRETMEEFAGVNPGPGEVELEKQAAAAEALCKIGYEEDAIRRAVPRLQAPDSHKGAIRKIVAWLGLAEDGDIAKNWLAVSRADSKAHERKFTRKLRVDDEYRERWAQPFDMVIRGVAAALQTKFAALIVRAGNLARMTDVAAALSAFEKQNIGAMTVQWHFYRSIEGPAWLPELINRQLVIEPLPRMPDDEGRLSYREWPVGQYLLKVAKGNDAKARAMLAGVLGSLAGSNHPDVRRDGLEILASLPPEEAAALSDVAVGWLTKEANILVTNPAERLLTQLAAAKQHDASLKVATALLQVFDRDGNVDSLYSRHMYEHSLPKIEETITGALGLDALRLLVSLLYETAVIGRKILLDPLQDYTSVLSGPLPEDDSAQYDIFGALAAAVRRSAVRLLAQEDADVRAIMDILLEHKFKIFERIALHVLAKKPEGAPELADQFLFDPGLLESYNVRHEYSELAIARFPQLSKERQAELLKLVDAIPGRYIDRYKQWIVDHEKREPTAEDGDRFAQAEIRNATWYWRSVLPTERQDTLAATVAKQGEPDAWKAGFDHIEQSPMSAKDFAAVSAKEIAAYLKAWAPGEGPAKETKTALGTELRNAVQADPLKFSTDATAFADLPPFYVRRLMEGMRFSGQNKATIDWEPVLQLIAGFMPGVTPPKLGETSVNGEDPSWFWAATEAAEVVRAGLQQGKDGIPFECDALIRAIIADVEKVAPAAPEFDDFEERYRRNAYFAAEATMLGLAADLHVLRIFWLSKHEGSPTHDKQRESLVQIPEFADFAARRLADKSSNGRIVRAILGRYLNWLLYFGEDWVKSNFDLIFPSDPDLADAAWLGHLLSDNHPAKVLMAQMTPLYRREIARLTDDTPADEKDYREGRIGDYLLVHYLWGSLQPGLIDEFWAIAPERSRKHVMWFLGNEMRRGVDMPADIRARGQAYWETRLAAGEAAKNKEHFRGELGAIGNWTLDTAIPSDWLLAQMLRMLKAGYAPGNSYSVVEWAFKISPQHPDGAVELIEAMFSNPHTEQWTFMGQQAAVRAILQAGKAGGSPKTRERVEAVISILASKGDISLIDLSDKPQN
jgi:hypothetical protein